MRSDEGQESSTALPGLCRQEVPSFRPRAQQHLPAAHYLATYAQARTFFRLDASRSLRLYDLWLSLGWVTAPPAQKKSAGGPGAAAGELGAGANAGGKGGEDAEIEEAI